MKMKLSMTCTDMKVREGAPIVFRGDWEECFLQIEKLGYDGVELHIHDSSQINRVELKKLLTRYHLDLTSIGTGTAYGVDHIFLSSEQEIVRNQAINRVKEHVLTAKDYDHAVVILGLITGKVSDCSSRSQFEENLKDSLGLCSEFAAEHGVYLGLEVLNRYEGEYFNTIEQGLVLLEQMNAPFLKLHIDTYHMNIEEGKIGAAIRKARGKICHVHLADSDRWYAGHGHYDFRETIDALKDIGYSHALAVESLSYPDSISAAKASFDTLKPLL